MTMIEIASFAQGQLSKWGLEAQGWRFRFGNRRKSLGLCSYRDKAIEVSRHFVNLPDEKIKNTVLHEIAHALAGGAAGHGPAWQRWAVQVGANPVRCASLTDDQRPAGKYYHHCPNCDRKMPVYRVPSSGRATACGECCGKHSGGRYDERFKMTLHETATGNPVEPVARPRRRRIKPASSWFTLGRR